MMARIKFKGGNTMKKIFKISTFIFGFLVEIFLGLCAFIGLGAVGGCKTEDERNQLVELVKRGWNIKN